MNVKRDDVSKLVEDFSKCYEALVAVSTVLQPHTTYCCVWNPLRPSQLHQILLPKAGMLLGCISSCVTQRCQDNHQNSLSHCCKIDTWYFTGYGHVRWLFEILLVLSKWRYQHLTNANTLTASEAQESGLASWSAWHLSRLSITCTCTKWT